MQRRIWMLLLVIFFLTSFLYAQDAQDAEDIDVYKYAGQLLPENLLKKIDITFEDVPLEMALNTIQDEYGIDLSYNNSRILAGKRINLQMKNVFVLEALLGVLKNAGMTLQVTQGGNLALVEGKVPSIGKSKKVGAGKIVGFVTDKTSGKPLPGANIILDGTSIGAASQVDGKYFIPNVPPGSYTLVVKYIGYKDVEIAINVLSKETVTVNAELEYAGLVAGEEITITAQAEGQIAAINQQLAASTIKNVVSADRIQEIPDVNAAESVGRLPGISIIRSGGEGQKVTIRGMSSKYNVMMVNGVRMQSTDRNDRSVDLNMIAPNILSGIEVTKALTADMDADAVGGTVNLKISKASEGFHSKFSAQDGYGSVGKTYSNYKLTGLVSNRFFDGKLGVQASGYKDDFNRNSDILSAEYTLNEEAKLEQGLIPIDLASTIIIDKVTDRRRTGGALVLDYQFSNGSLLLNNFISNLSEHQVEQQNSLALSGNQWSAFAADRELSNTVLSNALQGKFDFSSFGIDFSLSNSISKQFRPGDLRMNIGIAQNEAGFTTPTLEEPVKATPSELLNAAEIIKARDAKRVQRMHTLGRDDTESAREAILNFEVPFNISNYFSGKLKFGGKYVRNVRDNDENQHYNQPDRTNIGEEFVRAMKDSLWTDLGLQDVDQGLGIRAFLFEDSDYNIGDFLSGKEGVDKFFYTADIWKMNHFEELAINNDAYPIDVKESFQYDYKYARDLSAFYAMTELNVGNYVTLFPGIRYENFKFDYTAYFTNRFGPNPEDFRNEELKADSTKGENWFPQMHIRVKPTSWLDLRLAATKSIIYPGYRAVSPYMYYDSYSGPDLDLGNPSLKPALSHNYDIYTSVYDNYIGLFTAGYFYKEIEDLIVSTRFKTKDPAKINNRFPLIPTQQTDIHTWINLDATSYVRGFELDWQTHFWYLPSYLKGLVFDINYTHITSETTYPYQTAVKQGSGPFAKTVFVDSSRTGRMPDQPDDILNATLGYDIAGFSARLSFLFQDNVLRSANSSYAELDSYTGAYYRWDFTAYQKLPWEGIKLYLNINNITNRPDRQFISVLKNLSSVNYYGRTADIGLRYEF